MSHEAGQGETSKSQPRPDAARGSNPPAITDTTAEFEEYTAPPRLDEQGNPIPKAKGLAAAGYQFPPPTPGSTAPLTKANLAKGIGVPEVPRSKPAAKADWPVPPLQPASAAPSSQAAGVPRPSAVKVDEGDLFEEYQRPDLQAHPRTGKGIRAEPPKAPEPPMGPTAKDILGKMPEPELQVFTPKRFSPYQVKTTEEEAKAGGPHTPEHEKAALDVAADLAVHRKWLESATMSSPTAGPLKAVIDHSGDLDIAVPVPGPSPLPASALAPPPGPLSISEPTSMDVSLPANAALAATPTTTMSRAPVIESARPISAPYVPPPPQVVTTTHAAAPHASGAPPVERGGDVPRIGLVQADFHYDITTKMAQAAQDKARALGAPIAHHLHVPGAYDIPLAALSLLERDDVDAVVCIGTIVKGETGHDVLIARECARALTDLALELRKPVGLGVTGPEMTREQAWARISAGANAVESVVKQHRTLKQLRA